jgi:hypothetical protein
MKNRTTHQKTLRTDSVPSTMKDLLGQYDDFNKLLEMYIAHEIKKQGHELTKEQEKQIRDYIAQGFEGVLSIDDKTDALTKLEFDPNAFSEFVKKTQSVVIEQIPEIMDSMARVYWKSIKRLSDDFATESIAERVAFEARLYSTWRKPFNLFEVFIEMESDLGEKCIKQLRKRRSKKNKNLANALIRLHAKTCLVSREIAALIRAGYADGAHARWRSLYESVVTMSFLVDQGDAMAKAYLDHELIQKAANLRAHQYVASKINERLPSKQEMRRIERQRARLKSKYENVFDKPYGWAASAFSGREPKFSDIEEKSNFGHWRPYYKLASQSVHAQSHGLYFRLGLAHEPQANLLLANASDFGFADPAIGTVINLHTATAILYTLLPVDPDNLLALKTMDLFQLEIQKAFAGKQSELRKSVIGKDKKKTKLETS